MADQCQLSTKAFKTYMTKGSKIKINTNNKSSGTRNTRNTIKQKERKNIYA